MKGKHEQSEAKHSKSVLVIWTADKNESYKKNENELKWGQIEMLKKKKNLKACE